MTTYIWTLPTRIFHWFLAIGFASAYILGDTDKYHNLHFAFGAFVGALIIFRLLFGLLGPAYSRFKDFPMGLKKQTEFVSTYFSKTKFYAGHNPAASVIMLFILLNGLICGISGYLLYATENNVLSTGINEEQLKETHEVLANVFLVLIGLHLLGILGDTLFHGKTGTLQSIFTGYKNVDTTNATLNTYQKAYVLLWFVVPFYVFYLAYGLQTIAKSKEARPEGTEQFEQDDD
jgi:cytochrome b